MSETETPLVYGVWIPGKGWLRTDSGYFADTRQEVAECARRLYDAGLSTGARVEYFDEAMRDLQGLFLEREALAREADTRRKERRMISRLYRWVKHELLGFGHKSR